MFRLAQWDSDQSEPEDLDASGFEEESDSEDDFVAAKEPAKKKASMRVDDPPKSKKPLDAKKTTKDVKKQKDEVSIDVLALLGVK